MDKDTSHYDHLEAAKRPASDTSKGETSGKDQSICVSLEPPGLSA